ncbi:MAG: prepilin-type N-terminal cleavage/methylation domain-containing protein, partial [Nitrospinae bacterium]|nr:prepilin-type N-terminal cleavage/methylation domain-containing protein [Nitrospinota bacterium]
MLSKLNAAKNEKGFTLIELIIVIVILGIIAGVAIPKF